MRYRLSSLSTGEPCASVEAHVLARAYRAAWRAAHTGEPWGCRVLAELDLVMQFGESRSSGVTQAPRPPHTDRRRPRIGPLRIRPDTEGPPWRLTSWYASGSCSRGDGSPPIWSGRSRDGKPPMHRSPVPGTTGASDSTPCAVGSGLAEPRVDGHRDPVARRGARPVAREGGNDATTGRNRRGGRRWLRAGRGDGCAHARRSPSGREPRVATSLNAERANPANYRGLCALRHRRAVPGSARCARRRRPNPRLGPREALCDRLDVLPRHAGHPRGPRAPLRRGGRSSADRCAVRSAQADLSAAGAVSGIRR